MHTSHVPVSGCTAGKVGHTPSLSCEHHPNPALCSDLSLPSVPTEVGSSENLGGRCPGPSAELPVGMAGWAAFQLPSLAPPPSKGIGFCSPGGRPCPTPRGRLGHSPVSLFLGVLPGPFTQGRAPKLTVSLSFPPRSGDQARAPPYGCVGCTSLLKWRWLQSGDHAGCPPQAAERGVCG